MFFDSYNFARWNDFLTDHIDKSLSVDYLPERKMYLE